MEERDARRRKYPIPVELEADREGAHLRDTADVMERGTILHNRHPQTVDKSSKFVDNFPPQLKEPQDVLEYEMNLMLHKDEDEEVPLPLKFQNKRKDPWDPAAKGFDNRMYHFAKEYSCPHFNWANNS